MSQVKLLCSTFRNLKSLWTLRPSTSSSYLNSSSSITYHNFQASQIRFFTDFSDNKKLPEEETKERIQRENNEEVHEELFDSKYTEEPPPPSKSRPPRAVPKTAAATTELGGDENIISRLRRLSQTSPEDFVSSASNPETLREAKSRYSETLRSYNNQFSRRERERMGNPNYRNRQSSYRPRNDYHGGWGNDHYREFSTSTSVFLDRRLSGIEDAEEHDIRFIPDDKMNTNKLIAKVKELVDKQKVKEAVDFLLCTLEQGGFHYNTGDLIYTYNLCISSCAQVGYVKMAFKLFNAMKKRNFPPRASTYTSLFNACSNSTWNAEDNIERMNRLRENMQEKGVIPNQINYHAMIKGYGRNGDLQAAFAIVDEMITLGNIEPNAETFNMLLQACISNTADGFRHVLVTWRKMKSLRIRPDIFSYNLLLRAIRECGIQFQPDEDSRKSKNKMPQTDENHVRLLPPVASETESNNMLNLICLNEPQTALMNINQNSVDGGNEMTYEDVINALSLPENRLAVLGGIRGLMSQITRDKVGPNLKTITELGQIIHPGDVSDLLMMMKTYKLKPDIDFFNLVLKRFYFKNNNAGAKKLLASLPQFNLSPNIMTWGVVATGCNTWNKAKQLLNEMDETRFLVNVQIMGSLMHQACFTFDPQYVVHVMNQMSKREVTPDAKFILEIENFKQTVKKGLINQEIGKPVLPNRLSTVLERNPNFEESWRIFLFRYEDFMKKTEVRVEPKDPWAKDYENFLKNKSHNTLKDSFQQEATYSSI